MHNNRIPFDTVAISQRRLVPEDAALSRSHSRSFDLVLEALSPVTGVLSFYFSLSLLLFEDRFGERKPQSRDRERNNNNIKPIHWPRAQLKRSRKVAKVVLEHRVWFCALCSHRVAIVFAGPHSVSQKWSPPIVCSGCTRQTPAAVCAPKFVSSLYGVSERCVF